MPFESASGCFCNSPKGFPPSIIRKPKPGGQTPDVWTTRKPGPRVPTGILQRMDLELSPYPKHQFDRNVSPSDETSIEISVFEMQ